MSSMDTPISRKNEVVVQNMDGEVLIYDLRDNKAFCLNETSAIVWQLCDGNKTIGEISRELSNKLNSPANEDLVWFAIEQLKKEKLIENGQDLPTQFAGMSRREVIKKVGLGSVVALPIIAGLVAPAAVTAQSCLQTCMTIVAGVVQACTCVGGMNYGIGCMCSGVAECCAGSMCSPVNGDGFTGTVCN